MEKKLRAAQEQKEQLKLLAESGGGSESVGEMEALEKRSDVAEGERWWIVLSYGGNCSRKSYELLEEELRTARGRATTSTAADR
uniref:Uncharacterized protein n=1 Tax=Amphimedon queenslandica TaxID=400682 RepID=A0A1X7U6X8_AMPQE